MGASKQATKLQLTLLNPSNVVVTVGGLLNLHFKGESNFPVLSHKSFAPEEKVSPANAPDLPDIFI